MTIKSIILPAAILLAAASVSGQHSVVFDPTIITAPPKGIVHDMLKRSTTILMQYSEEDYEIINDRYAYSKYVLADNGDVYLYRPLAAIKDNCYLKLQRGNGDTLVAHLPQAIYELQVPDFDGQVESTMFYAFPMLKKPGDVFLQPDTVTGATDYTMRFTLTDGVLKQVDNDRYLGMITDDFTWGLIAEKDVRVDSFSGVPNVLPASAEAAVSDYVLKYTDPYLGETYKMTKGAVSDGKVYLRNPLSPPGDSQWIAGDIDGNKAVMKYGQYLGVDTVSLLHYMYFMSALYDEQQQELQATGQLELNFDSQRRKFSSVGPAEAMIINAGPDEPNPAKATFWLNPSFYEFQSQPATPVTPSIQRYYVFDAGNDAYAYFKFEVQPFDVDGNYINPDSLFYVIYVDGKPFTLTPGVYKDLKTDMTEIPFDYRDSDVQSMGAYVRQVYIYQPLREEQLGVQSVYRCNGVERRSPICTTGIDAVKTAGASQASGHAYDLQGRRVDASTRGQVIIVDGKKILK